jgi:hypothetical protein
LTNQPPTSSSASIVPQTRSALDEANIFAVKENSAGESETLED